MSGARAAVAVVFPGQGSQAVSMLAELNRTFPVVAETFAEASDALGFDLWSLTQTGPEETLNQTQNTQPALLAAGVAVWRVWLGQNGASPLVMAGHSLGEYTALVCSGALEFATGVTLVAERGKQMQNAVPPGEGAMAAILGLPDETVADVCRQVANGAILEPANFNAPGQVVIAGEHAAVERATVAAKKAGAKRAVVLPVSVPSHCSLMQPAAEVLTDRLETVAFEAPQIPVLHNVDVSEHKDAGSIRKALAQQLCSPVRWVETVQTMSARGVGRIVELGPGRVLSGLNRRIDRDLECQSVSDPASLELALAEQRLEA